MAAPVPELRAQMPLMPGDKVLLADAAEALATAGHHLAATIKEQRSIRVTNAAIHRMNVALARWRELTGEGS